MLTPSMNLKDGTAPQGKLVTNARGSPYDGHFTNKLEETLFLAAKLKTSDHFKFKQTPKLDPHTKADTPVPNKMLYEMKFQLKKNVKTLLVAGLTHFKKDLEMRLTHLHDELTSKPFPGDMYHYELFMDSSAPGVDSIPLSSYGASAYAGGMRQQTFQGIRRGSKVLQGTGDIKECPYVGIYCDSEQTANHGLQTVNEDPDSWIHVGDEIFKSPLYKIVDSPSIVVYKDSKHNYMYKHPLYKASAWCQDCWGPKKHCQNPEWKEAGKYCAYSNFCKICLAFNPKQTKYTDLALSKHMCN